MTISRTRNTASIDINEGPKADISYCPKCAKSKRYNILSPRIYNEGENDSDRDMWRQCWHCGKIVGIYELKKESVIVPFVEPRERFDTGEKITPIGLKRGGKRGQLKHHSDHKIDDGYKDSDVNRMVKKGGKVLSYNER